MKKSVRKLEAPLLAGAIAVSTAGCMPTAEQQDTIAAQNTQESSTAQGNVGGNEAAQDTGETAAELTVDTQTPITLRIDWWGGDSGHQTTLTVIEKFQEKYPDVTAIVEYKAFNSHKEKIALGTKSDNTADVMQLDWSWVPIYSPSGDNFYDLSKISNILNLDNYTERSRAMFTINGKLDAIPIGNTGRIFYWNKTTFDKIGVEIPGTLDELLAVGKASEVYGESYYPLVTEGLGRVFLMVYYLQCRYDKDWVEGGVLQHSQEEVAEGSDFLKNPEDNHTTSVPQKMAGDGVDLIDINVNWIDGHYTDILLYGTSVVKYAEAVKDGEFVIGDYAEMGDYHGGFIKINQTSGIGTTMGYPAEVAALIQFPVTEEDDVKTLRDTRGVSTNKEGLAMSDLNEDRMAEANTKAVAWSSFQVDPISERNSFVGVDGTFFNALQLSSYGESDSMSCVKIVLDGIAQEPARQGRRRRNQIPKSHEI